MSTHYRIENRRTKGTLKKYVKVTHEIDPEHPEESFGVLGYVYRMVRSHKAVYFRRDDGLVVLRCPVKGESETLTKIPAFCPMCGGEVVR